MDTDEVLQRLIKDVQSAWKELGNYPEDSMHGGDYPECEVELSYCIQAMKDEILKLRKVQA